MAIRRVRHTFYALADMGTLALSSCTGASTPPSAAYATPAPDLRAAYNRPYQGTA